MELESKGKQQQHWWKRPRRSKDLGAVSPWASRQRPRNGPKAILGHRKRPQRQIDTKQLKGKLKLVDSELAGNTSPCLVGRFGMLAVPVPEHLVQRGPEGLQVLPPWTLLITTPTHHRFL